MARAFRLVLLLSVVALAATVHAAGYHRGSGVRRPAMRPYAARPAQFESDRGGAGLQDPDGLEEGPSAADGGAEARPAPPIPPALDQQPTEADPDSSPSDVADDSSSPAQNQGDPFVDDPGQTDLDELGPLPGDESSHEDMPPYPYEAPALTCSSGSWLNRGDWYAAQDFSYLHRSTQDTLSLALDISNASQIDLRGPMLDTERGLGFAPGTRLTFGRFLCRDGKNRDHSAEFTFFGLHEWDMSRGLQSGDPQRLVTLLDPSAPTFQLGGFNFTDVQTFDYHARHNSYELNYRVSRRLGRDKMVLLPNGCWVRKCDPSILGAIFGGPRIVSLEERFVYRTRTFDDVREGTYIVNTNNDLIGLQVGGDVFVQHCAWRLGIQGKAGPYINFSDQSTHVNAIETDPDAEPVPTRNELATADEMAFVGELRLMGAYQIRPNMALRASYDFMWINQLALAPEQVSFVVRTPPEVITGGALFFQGISLGFEMVW